MWTFRNLLIIAAVAVVGVALFYAYGVDHSVPLENLPEVDYQVYFFDVGQGDAILIDYGDDEMLIDGGPSDRTIIDRLDVLVQGDLEAIVMTHPHDDHIGGLRDVVHIFTVDAIYKSSDNASTKAYKDVIGYVSPDIVHVVSAGDFIALDNLRFKVLNSPWCDDPNENSLVIELDTSGAKFLFTGDIGEDTENFRTFTDIDILKIAHHGSRYSTSKHFVSQTTPEVAIYCAGLINYYGHPDASTLDRLHESVIYGTAINGDIWVNVTSDNYAVFITKGGNGADTTED